MHKKKISKFSFLFLFLLFVPMFEETSAVHLTKPVILLEQTTFSPGDIITVNGWIEQDDKTINSLEINLRNPDRNIIVSDIINTEGDGKFNYQIEIDRDSNFGKYTLEVSRGCGLETDTDCHFEVTTIDFLIIQSEEKLIETQDELDVKIPSLITKEQKPKAIDETVSDTDLIILFSASIIVVAGIWIYLARHAIFKKKDEYENKEYASKEDRTYEKYHSDWTSDDAGNARSSNKSVENEFKKALQSATLPDYYSILGITKNATQNEIKHQFRKLAKKWHPDKKGGHTEKRMTEINKAYEVLSNLKTKEAYDKFFNSMQT